MFKIEIQSLVSISYILNLNFEQLFQKPFVRAVVTSPPLTLSSDSLGPATRVTR